MRTAAPALLRQLRADDQLLARSSSCVYSTASRERPAAHVRQRLRLFNGFARTLSCSSAAASASGPRLRADARPLACGNAASVYDFARTPCCLVVHGAFVCSTTHHHQLHSGTRLPQQCANCPPNFKGPLAYISKGGVQGPVNFTHRSCLRAQSREVSHRLSARTLYSITNDTSKRWIDSALGSAMGVSHVSKFYSSVRTISSHDITRFSSSPISCTSENDFSGFGTCAQHGNIFSQVVRAEPALLDKLIFSPPSPPYGSTSKGFQTPQCVNTPQ